MNLWPYPQYDFGTRLLINGYSPTEHLKQNITNLTKVSIFAWTNLLEVYLLAHKLQFYQSITDLCFCPSWNLITNI